MVRISNEKHYSKAFFSGKMEIEKAIFRGIGNPCTTWNGRICSLIKH